MTWLGTDRWGRDQLSSSEFEEVGDMSKENVRDYSSGLDLQFILLNQATWMSLITDLKKKIEVFKCQHDAHLSEIKQITGNRYYKANPGLYTRLFSPTSLPPKTQVFGENYLPN